MSQTMSEHRRLAILRHLEASAGYTSNSSILLDVVCSVGIQSSDDQIIGALAWLGEQELVSIDTHGALTIATATARGADVATGRAQHPGVKRPTPRG